MNNLSSNVLGECVSCGENALAYTGATTAPDGKYLCARCSAAKKAGTKPVKKAPSLRGPNVRRDYPEPPAVHGARWLQLGDDRFALVDVADFRRANTKSWFILGGHAARREQWAGKVRHDYLHRFVLGLDPGLDDKASCQVEFIDQNPLNCRRGNLRVTPV